MKFMLLVTGPAYGTQQAISAYLFAKAIFNQKHILSSIFFYKEGVLNGNFLTIPSNDEFNLIKKWEEMYIKNNTSLYICISSSLRRGVINKKEAKKCFLPHWNLQKNFKLIGLLKVANKLMKCDRLVQF